MDATLLDEVMEDLQAIEADGEAQPTQMAKAKAMMLAETFGVALCNAMEIAMVVGDNDESGLEIVFHSFATKRRISIFIDKDGNATRCVAVGAGVKRFQEPELLDAVRYLIGTEKS